MKLKRFVLPLACLLASKPALASSFEALPSDLIVELTNQGSYAALHLLSQADGYLQSLIHSQEFAKNSKWGVKVDDRGEVKWMLWHQALQGEARLITRWNDLDFILTHLPAWDNETERAVRDGTEPAYLKTISSLAGAKVRRFLAVKRGALTSPQERSKHAYSVLFTMTAYNSTGRFVAWNSARDVAACAAVGAAREAAWGVARDAAYSATWNAAKHAAHDAANSAAYDAASGALGDAARQACRASIVAWASGELAYRTAEKASLLYFAQDAENILAAAYNAAYAELRGVPSENIFTSRSAWKEFKEQYFGELVAEQLHFLQAWLDELDGIVESPEARQG